jgi:hypothetical protein
MNEIRISFHSNYTQIPNQVIRDPQLSLKAKGMFCLLISHGEGYAFSSMRLMAESSDGEHATKQTLKELESAGYLQRNKQPSGRCQYVLLLPESEPKCENPTVGKSHNEKIPQRENHPHKEHRSLKNTDTIKNTDNNVPTRSELPTICFTITDILINFVQNRYNLKKTKNRKAWADHVRKMNTVDGIDYEQILQGVKWYTTLDDYPKHCPIIESTESLRNKWIKLLNYSKKIAIESKVDNSIKQRTATDLELLSQYNKPQGK